MNHACSLDIASQSTYICFNFKITKSIIQDMFNFYKTFSHTPQTKINHHISHLDPDSKQPSTNIDYDVQPLTSIIPIPKSNLVNLTQISRSATPTSSRSPTNSLTLSDTSPSNKPINPPSPPQTKIHSPTSITTCTCFIFISITCSRFSFSSFNFGNSKSLHHQTGLY